MLQSTSNIAYTVFVYGHIQGVGVTAYCIYNNVHIEAEEVGPNVTNIVGKYCFLAVISKHEVSKCTTCSVLDGTKRWSQCYE